MYHKIKIINLNKINQIGSSLYTVDLINFNNKKQKLGLLKIHSDKGKKTLFSPIYNTIEEATKNSPTNTCHLVIPGLLPTSNSKWKKYNNEIFFMPNDKTPHFHGDATHHMGHFNINEVFLMSSNKYSYVQNKKLTKYRNNLRLFNSGYNNQPIETWIHWQIPYNKLEYPSVRVKKNSIIWWDFNSIHHNLCLVSREQYNNNIFSNNLIKISKGNNPMEILVTIMDKVGIFYFACTIEGHAALGHKIKIIVED